LPKFQSTNPYHKRRLPLTRISISLPSGLLTKFDESMVKAGYTDRSKALQTAIHSLIDDYSWKSDDSTEGAGVIIMMYDNHAYNQDKKSTLTQHQYTDVISASTHVHLKNNNCLETIIVKGDIKKIRDLAKHLSENRGIKSLKVNFMSVM
jgi:CopG family transcriptional regulator, nickel-responsive regulator